MMLILFFNSKGVIHHAYVPEGQTVNNSVNMGFSGS